MADGSTSEFLGARPTGRQRLRLPKITMQPDRRPSRAHQPDPPRARRSPARSWWGVPLVLAAALLVVLPSASLLTLRGGPAPPAQSAPAIAPATYYPAVWDNGHLNLTVASHVVSGLTDEATFRSGTPHLRSYAISVVTTVPYLLSSCYVVTEPLAQWGDPAQLPGGTDALPPLSFWSWTVTHNGHNDTGNWTAGPVLQSLKRLISWQNGTYVVTGRVGPTLPITVYAKQTSGWVAPRDGFVFSGGLTSNSGTSNDSGFLAMGQTLAPATIRFGMTSVAGNVTWNSSTNAPVFRWAPQFSRTFHYAAQLPANVLLDLPAGTWGDGNVMPSGMPLNTSLPVLFYGTTGYFPTVAAYAAYVSAIVQHVMSSNESVTYWNIGNEVPRISATEVAAYVRLFNAAASVIHRALPSALVGSDVMMDPNYISQFAKTAQGVGYLSFHYYGASGMCTTPTGGYCPPAGGTRGTTDPTMVTVDSFGHMYSWDAPRLAQMIWHNVSGVWLPVFDAETNVNHMGGQLTRSSGTDPRIQTLFGASWFIAALMDGATENLTQVLYFSLTGPTVPAPSTTEPYGGWGFQMTSEGTNDNDTLYAPYWGLDLWARGSAGGTMLNTTGSDRLVAEAMAFRNGSSVAVVLVNRVNVSVNLTVSFVGGSLTPRSLYVLDQNSYREVFDPVNRTEVLQRSGVSLVSPYSNPVTVTINGYGVALLVEG